MRRRLRAIRTVPGMAGIVCLCACGGSPAGPTDTGYPPPTRDLPDRIDPGRFLDSLKTFMPGRDSGGYDAPSSEEREAFLALFDLAVRGEARQADSLAQAFRYDVEHTTEESSGDTLIAIVERAPIVHGWGTVLIRSGGAPVDIHVNHPLFDINTPRVAGEIFESCVCRALIMAGTHRYANGGDASDMARSTTSMFEGVHERLADTGVMALSVHGFTNDSYGGPTATADVVLSNGATPSGELAADPSTLALRDLLREQAFAAGHVAVDPGWVFLTATSNPQGRHSNARFGPGRWVHIEIDREVRDTATRWRTLVGIVAEWLEEARAVRDVRSRAAPSQNQSDTPTQES